MKVFVIKQDISMILIVMHNHSIQGHIMNNILGSTGGFNKIRTSIINNDLYYADHCRNAGPNVKM